MKKKKTITLVEMASFVSLKKTERRLKVLIPNSQHVLESITRKSPRLQMVQAKQKSLKKSYLLTIMWS